MEVFIHESPNCDPCDAGGGQACAFPTYQSGIHVRTDIYLEPDSCGTPWTLGGGNNYQGVVTHELGHAWGIDDEYPDDLGNLQCEGTFWCSSMAGNSGNAGRNITRRDIGSLRDLYGTRSPSLTYYESSDLGLTWAAGSPGQTLATSLRSGSMGDYATKTSSAEFSGRSFTTTTPTQVRYGLPGSAYTSQTPSTGIWAYSWDVSSVAVKSQCNYAVAVRSNETEPNSGCDKEIRVWFTSDCGASWASAAILEEAGVFYRSRSEGVAIAYDPGSDMYVVGYVDDETNPEPARRNSVVFSTIQGSFPYSLMSTEYTAFKAVDYPAIACVPASYTTYNCIFAWLAYSVNGDPATYSNQITWRRANINPSTGDIQFQYSTANYIPVSGKQTPGLTRTRNGTYPFIMTYKGDGTGPGETLHSRRFSTTTGQWVDLRTIRNSSFGMYSGAAVDSRNSGVFETHVWYVQDFEF